jgi:BlaI family transcriptional regulator, penicillinase repressor
MPDDSPYSHLSRRERQIMDILYQLGDAPAEAVRTRLPDPPSYSAARAMLAKLEDKGYVTHYEEELRYVYRPTVPREEASHSALSRVVTTFFDGSISQAVTGLLSDSADEILPEELDRLAAIIDAARERRGGDR